MFVAKDPFLSWLFDDVVHTFNWEDRNKKYILSFSGGKDSTALLLKMIDYDLYLDKVIYVDVGMQFPAMKDHIQKVKNYVEQHGIDFITLKPENNFKYWLGDHVKTRGKNKGKKGYGWPDFRNRWCTSQLKLQTLNKYYKNHIVNSYDDPVEFVGIASDEKERTKKNNKSWFKEYPLVYWDIEESEALEYCYSKGFDWGGLYKKFGRVSCYLCPLSKLEELKFVFFNYPQLWLKMRMLDDMSFRDFRSDYTLKELERKFIAEMYQDLFGYKQLSLFKSA